MIRVGVAGQILDASERNTVQVAGVDAVDDPQVRAHPTNCDQFVIGPAGAVQQADRDACCQIENVPALAAHHRAGDVVVQVERIVAGLAVEVLDVDITQHLHTAYRHRAAVDARGGESVRTHGARNRVVASPAIGQARQRTARQHELVRRRAADQVLDATERPHRVVPKDGTLVGARDRPGIDDVGAGQGVDAATAGHHAADRARAAQGEAVRTGVTGQVLELGESLRGAAADGDRAGIGSVDDPGVRIRAGRQRQSVATRAAQERAYRHARTQVDRIVASAPVHRAGDVVVQVERIVAAQPRKILETRIVDAVDAARIRIAGGERVRTDRSLQGVRLGAADQGFHVHQRRHCDRDRTGAQCVRQRVAAIAAVERTGRATITDIEFIIAAQARCRARQRRGEGERIRTGVAGQVLKLGEGLRGAAADGDRAGIGSVDDPGVRIRAGRQRQSVATRAAQERAYRHARTQVDRIVASTPVHRAGDVVVQVERIGAVRPGEVLETRIVDAANAARIRAAGGKDIRTARADQSVGAGTAHRRHSADGELCIIQPERAADTALDTALPHLKGQRTARCREAAGQIDIVSGGQGQRVGGRPADADVRVYRDVLGLVVVGACGGDRQARHHQLTLDPRVVHRVLTAPLVIGAVHNGDRAGIEQHGARSAIRRGEIGVAADVDGPIARYLRKPAIAPTGTAARRNVSVKHGRIVRPDDDLAAVAADVCIRSDDRAGVDGGEFGRGDAARALIVAADENGAAALGTRRVDHRRAGQRHRVPGHLDVAADVAGTGARGVQQAAVDHVARARHQADDAAGAVDAVGDDEAFVVDGAGIDVACCGRGQEDAATVGDQLAGIAHAVTDRGEILGEFIANLEQQ